MGQGKSQKVKIQKLFRIRLCIYYCALLQVISSSS
uniref:Uncharacterized protein n=1 Tax=Rhizophora mucronata TaxID=61149 RepID=A0A2P2QUF5_RHIMU